MNKDENRELNKSVIPAQRLIGVFIQCRPPDKTSAGHNEGQTDGRPTPGNQRCSAAAPVLSVACLSSGGPAGRLCVCVWWSGGGSHPDEKTWQSLIRPPGPGRNKHAELVMEQFRARWRCQRSAAPGGSGCPSGSLLLRSLLD